MIDVDTNFWFGFTRRGCRCAVSGKPLHQVFVRIPGCPEQKKSCQASVRLSSGNTDFSWHLAVPGGGKRHGLYDASGSDLAVV